MEARGNTDRQIVCYAWRKGRKRIEQSSSLCPSGETFSQTEMCKIQWLLLVNLQVT